MATVAEPQSQLSDVEAAIASLMTRKAKSYSIDGRSFTYLELNDLIAWRDRLKKEISAASGTRRVSRKVRFA